MILKSIIFKNIEFLNKKIKFLIKLFKLFKNIIINNIIKILFKIL